MLDSDLETMSPEELKASLLRLRQKVRHVVTQKGDNLCWRDVYTDLASELPENPQVDHTPPTPVFLTNCGKFERCMRENATYIAGDKPLELDRIAWIKRKQEWCKGAIHPEAWRGVYCVMVWFDCMNQNGGKYPPSEFLAIDIDHSALLDRLLRGKEPLPFAPPKAMSYPWYDVIETGEGSAHDVSEHSFFPGQILINQHRWIILERLEQEEFIVTYRKGGDKFRLYCVGENSWGKDWRLQLIREMK